jgi:Domain of unknown function (DUF4410)
MRELKIWALATALLCSACASGVRRADVTPAEHFSASSGPVAKSVTISLSDDAQKKVAENVKFNPQTLLDTVKRAMQTSKVLDENSEFATRSVDIVITDMRARSNFTAIAFGFMAGADMVKGDVVTHDLQGKEIGRFEVHADYALGGIAGGMDSTRMDWLYEKFAQLTLESLQGTSDADTGKSGGGKSSGGK